MGLYAVIRGEEVDGIAVADAPLDTDGVWIEITNMNPQPSSRWGYKNGVFIEPVRPDPVESALPEKTEEEKLADAAAALVAKLIADGVLKQA